MVDHHKEEDMQNIKKNQKSSVRNTDNAYSRQCSLILTLFQMTFTSYRLCHIFFTLPPSDHTKLPHVDLLCKAMIAPTHNYNPGI